MYQVFSLKRRCLNFIYIFISWFNLYVFFFISKSYYWSEVKVTQSCLILCDPMDCSPQNSPGQNTGEGSLSLLQGIFPTQGSSPILPHCRRILYQLSYQRSPGQIFLLKGLFLITSILYLYINVWKSC